MRQVRPGRAGFLRRRRGLRKMVTAATDLEAQRRRRDWDATQTAERLGELADDIGRKEVGCCDVDLGRRRRGDDGDDGEGPASWVRVQGGEACGDRTGLVIL